MQIVIGGLTVNTEDIAAFMAGYKDWEVAGIAVNPTKTVKWKEGRNGKSHWVYWEGRKDTFCRVFQTDSKELNHAVFMTLMDCIGDKKAGAIHMTEVMVMALSRIEGKKAAIAHQATESRIKELRREFLQAIPVDTHLKFRAVDWVEAAHSCEALGAVEEGNPWIVAIVTAAMDLAYERHESKVPSSEDAVDAAERINRAFLDDQEAKPKAAIEE